jgi:hypothetical protein
MKQVLNTNGVDRTQALWQYVTGQNIPAWSSTAYLQGDTVIDSNNVGWYCIQGNTNQTPSSSPTYWQVYDAVGTGVRDIIVKDGYFIGPPSFYAQPNNDTLAANYGAYPLIDSDYPVAYQPYPTVPSQSPTPVINFSPFAIAKDKLDYKTGFEASSLSLTLSPRDPNQNTTYGTMPSGYKRGTPNGSGLGYPEFSQGFQGGPPYADVYSHTVPSGGVLPLYQTLRQSFAQTTDWYLAPVTMYRFFMPTPGDTTTFGAAVMFRGRISEMQVGREDIKLTVSSLMQVFKQKVPSQTIQPGNRWAPFDFTATEDFLGQSVGAGNGGYNWAVLNFGAHVIHDGDLDEGFAYIISNASGGNWFRHVYTNQNTFINGSGQYISTVTFVENLPTSLGLNGVNQVYLWKSSDTGTNPSGPGAGLPYVPQPFTGIA